MRIKKLNPDMIMILGRDLMHELGMIFDFKEGRMTWDNSWINMQNPSLFDEGSIKTFEEELFLMHDPDTTEAERIQQIVDAKYNAANLQEEVLKVKNINKEERKQLYKLLRKYGTLFDGALGTWKTEPISLKLKDPKCVPYHAKPYPVPHSQEKKLKAEVKRLVDWGILRKVNRSEWAMPAFTITKPDGTLRSLSDSRELNKRIKRMPYPLPKIQEILRRLQGFQWATALDLNMGYYHIQLDPESSKLCTVVFPWGKYEYTRLPMGLCNSPDIFQEKMNDLIQDLEFAQAYIDDLLVTTKSSFEDHLTHLEQVLSRLQEKGLKVNLTKSKLCQTELEYLGYWITRKGIQPLTKKVEAILAIAQPKTKKQLRSFIGMVNFYRDVWPKRSELLAPLTTMT